MGGHVDNAKCEKCGGEAIYLSDWSSWDNNLFEAFECINYDCGFVKTMKNKVVEDTYFHTKDEIWSIRESCGLEDAGTSDRVNEWRYVS